MAEARPVRVCLFRSRRRLAVHARVQPRLGLGGHACFGARARARFGARVGARTRAGLLEATQVLQP
eukprot:scaffold127716_cov72-Phaeocystis_antarctica.AAC.1